MKWNRRAILRYTVGILIAIGAAYGGLRLLAMAFGPPDDITNVADYPSTLKQWSASGLVSHFPANIPPQAQNVRFAAYPGYLQGGAYIQLRMQLPASQIIAIEAQLKNATTHVYAGGDRFDHYNEDQKNNWPTTGFVTSDDPKSSHEFPSHYTLYALSASNHGSGSWNHGQTTGVAISTTLNEVVYWADSW